LKDSLAMFGMILFDYTGEQIKQAFLFWMKTNNQFPTPADIVNIIERDGKPAFDKTVYVNLCKKRQTTPDDLRSSEWEYMEDYERFAITGGY